MHNRSDLRPLTFPFEWHLTDIERAKRFRQRKGHDALMNARNQMLKLIAADPNLVRVRPNGLEDTPRYQLHIDQDKAIAMGVAAADVNSQLQSAWGSIYVNNVTDKGQIKQVLVQGDSIFRMLHGNMDCGISISLWAGSTAAPMMLV